jgi:nicotinamidase-related amidase
MTADSGYDLRHTGLLHVDPYNDFITEGGKLWGRSQETIEGVGLLEHTRALIAAGDRLGVRRFIVPHRRWQPGDYDGWDHPSPTQRAAAAAKLFAAGEWGGQFRDEFAPRDDDVVICEHWASSGFANTDLDMRLKQHGITHVVIFGMRANTCIDTTARYAQELGYHVTLIRDAIGAFSWDEIKITFDINAPTYAHVILTTAAFLDTLDSGRPDGLADLPASPAATS